MDEELIRFFLATQPGRDPLSVPQLFATSCVLALLGILRCPRSRAIQIVLIPFLCSLPLSLAAQNSAISDPGQWLSQGSDLLRRARYREAEAVFRQWVEHEPANPSAQYNLALSLALQSRWEEALRGFQHVLELDPKRADAHFETAAVLLELNRPAEAFRWAHRGLRLEQESDYGLELSGSLSFLLDSKIEALAYWNRLNRPHLTSMDIIVPDGFDRYSIAEEMDLKPGDLLSASELTKASWRLAQHPHIRTAEFNPVPGAQPDEFSLEVRVAARSGFGSPADFLANTFGQIAFQTATLSYWDLFGKGTSIEMPVRWNPRARWFRFSLESSRAAHLPIYPTISYAWRDEDWNLGSGHSFRLRSHQVGTSLVFPIALPRLSARFKAGYRWRAFDADEESTTLSSSQTSTGAYFIGLNPSLNILKQDAPVGWKLSSDLKSEVMAIRSQNQEEAVAFRTSLSWESRMENSSADGLDQSLQMDVHAGWISESSLVEDLFVLGMGPDTDFALRAHPVFRESRKGRNPVAGRFALANLTWRREVHKIGLLRLGILAFTDIGNLGRRLPGQPSFHTLIDSGAGLELGWGPLRSTRLSLAYGRDWRGERNALYIGTRFP